MILGENRKCEPSVELLLICKSIGSRCLTVNKNTVIKIYLIKNNFYVQIM